MGESWLIREILGKYYQNFLPDTAREAKGQLETVEKVQSPLEKGGFRWIFKLKSLLLSL
jgi:hypothetical protein